MPYHQFKNEGGLHGSFEVFQQPQTGNLIEDEDGAPYPADSWFWWPCFPGCLPDGEPHGPFKTEAEAIADAQES